MRSSAEAADPERRSWVALTAAVWVLVGGLLALLVVTVAYSYRVWAGDPAKQPIGRNPAT